MLAYWSGQDMVVIAVPSLGRNHPQLQRTVGCFFNLLAICSSVECTWSGVQLVNAARDSMRKAQANSDVPFLEIRRNVNPARDASTTQIFQALIMPVESNLAAEDNFGVPQKPLPVVTVSFPVLWPRSITNECMSEDSVPFVPT